ncbi:MAG: T9SS type A sorting domain-containing protein, partial [Candidatus Cloacimonadota bacterium]|nr:T9SS type A sorting domain-containing protein [Candidatus Cloacimonadota bacterium]
WLEVVTFDGNTSVYGSFLYDPNSSGNEPELNKFALEQNFPNPVVASTSISFALGKTVKNAELTIYNVLGQTVRTYDLTDFITAKRGEINWNGKDQNGKNVSSGIYFYKLNTGSKQAVRKMIFIR